jgi:hypothetical protein
MFFMRLPVDILFVAKDGTVVNDPETRLPSSRRTAEAMTVTLHELLARGAELEWFEAVALVQALCTHLLDDAPAAGIRVPDLHEIAFDADGTIETTGEGPSGQSPVFRVGQLLLALVAGKPMPVPLRLLALTAASSAPPYASVAELTAALDFYERPDRLGVIRAVYGRFEKLPTTAKPGAPVEEIPAKPKPAPRPAASIPHWWRRHPRVVASFVALVLVASAAASWLVLRQRMPWLVRDSRQVAAAVGTATDAIARQVSSGVQAVKAHFGLSKATEVKHEEPPPSSQPAPVESPADVPAPSAPVPSPAQVPAPRAPSQMPVSLPPSAGWPEPVDPPVIPPPSVPTPAVDHTPKPTVEPAPLPTPAVEPDGGTIYSAENRDVVPPTAIHARVPSEPPPGVRPGSLPLLELVISASGEVESARLLTPSPNVSTSMMVSAAKAWRFEPASRNGRPVRYRLRLRLASQ